jgi:hypothetical protein
MTEKGYISKVIGYKRYYIISSLNGEDVILFFEELCGNKLINGDLIEYEVVESKEFGKCALNPQKTGNIHFNKLKNALDNGNTIEGYVYEKNEGGYLISYNGYKCFLPNSESTYKDIHPENDFVNTYQIFNVINIENESVVLSRKFLLKKDLENLRLSEIADIKTGFTYIGKAKSVEGFGVFIKYKYSEGLLHISNILITPIQSLNKKEKNGIEIILSKVFLKGREVLVTVDRLNDTQYSVTWNKNVEPNKEICIELNSYGLST